MGKYSRQLSARLRKGMITQPLQKVTQDDIFPVTKILTYSGYDPELVHFQIFQRQGALEQRELLCHFR